MVHHEIKIHDKRQFELKLHYDFSTNRSNGEYFLEIYFFVPNVLGINKHSFHKKNFYDSIKSYVRLATPEFTLPELLEKEDSPFNSLLSKVDKVEKHFHREHFDEFEQYAKMFCVTFTASVRDTFVGFRKTEKDKLIDEINEFISNSKKIILRYRELQEKLKSKKEHSEILSFGDEYLSLVIEKYLFKILVAYFDNSEDAKSETKSKIIAFINTEIERRKEKNYRSIVKLDSSNEEMLFRFNTLKKYFSSILSLEKDVEREGTILEQILFSLAAGMAMLFATAVAFWGQTTFGNLTMSFFIVLVVSYMFKDRIKEILRELMKKSVFKYLFDYKYILYIDQKLKIGVIRESFDFVKWKKLPKHVIRIRELFRTKEFDNKFQKEKIILYRKKISLKTSFLNRKKTEELKTISDIFRFDISRFLSKMDDPRKELFVLTGNSYQKVYGKRVYHVNLVLRILRDNKEKLERFRLILTKKGIERIEPLVIDD